MSADPQQVQNVFTTAVEIADLQKRQEFLAAECAGNSELLRRVHELLAAFDRPKRFLDQPTLIPANLEDSDSGGQHPGSIVAGKYKLLEAIGEGGMGTVWVAEQTKPVRRKVALKLVKPGMDSRQVLARFDAERQALALMDHPNIARVFDGGVNDEGRPFFAMEYVKGMPLTEYCDQVRLSLEERLRLFVPICQAVQHAHQKGIIHRDLKPSNVLICLYDGKPVPKVIDFGLAKAMHQPLTEQTLHTGHGLMLGTPLYMSPEQAEHNNLDVDTRTDVYSLGVMLYELLTGTTPLEKAQFKEAAFGEILRLIKEVEPPKPSTRVSTNAQRASIAAQRNLDPEQLGRSIRGDLDWIIMKALDKERDRRYETANGLARDIERFLNAEPVEACPPSTSYRLRKQFQKHKAAISTAAAFLFLLCAGAAISTWQAYRATTAEKVAVKAEAAAREQRDKALENERQALTARTAESMARIAEEQARTAESQQRSLAESQKAEAEKQRDEAQRLQREAVTRSAELEKLSEKQRQALYASDMNLVRLEAMRGDMARVREILYAQLPVDQSDLRGLEWNYWYRYLTQAKKLQQIPNVEMSLLSKPVLLPGGQLTAVPERGGYRLVETLTGKTIQQSAIDPTRPNSIAFARFSAKGHAAFIESAIQENVTNGTQSPEVGNKTAESYVVYDPNGQPKRWTAPGESFGKASGITISEDGRFVAVVGKEVTHTPENPVCRILVWNVETQELVLDRVENRLLTNLALSPDGSHVAGYCSANDSPLFRMSGEHEVIVILRIGEEVPLGVIRHSDVIEFVQFHSDNRGLIFTTRGLMGDKRRQVMGWNPTEGHIQRLTSEHVPIDGVTRLSPDNRWMAISSPSSRTIRIFDARFGTLRKTFHNEKSNILSFSFNEATTQLVAVCADGEVVQWQMSTDDDRYGLRSRPLPDYGASSKITWEFSSDQKYLAYFEGSDHISVRSIDGQEIFKRESIAKEQGDYIRSVAVFNNRSDLLAVATETRPNMNQHAASVEVIDLKTARVLWSTPLPSREMGNRLTLLFSNDSSVLAVAWGFRIYHLDARNGAMLGAKFETDGNVFFVPHAFCRSQDGMKTLVPGYQMQQGSTRSEQIAVVYDVFSGEKIASLENQRFRTNPARAGAGNNLTLSPDGDTLARIGEGGTVELWNLKTQRLIANLKGNGIVFSNDGSLVLSATMSPFYGAESGPRPSFTNRFAGQRNRTLGPSANPRIYSTTNGQLVSTLEFAGDPTVEYRFSPDGKRVFTLHGLQAGALQGGAAYVRVWDCQTGLDMLDLPVTMESQCNWDLQVSPTGESLTSLVLSQYPGNAAELGSTVFDATPLPQEVDAELVSSNWLKKLEATTPVPQQIIDAIFNNKIATPLVRQTALTRAQQMPFDAQKIADRCLESLCLEDLPKEQYSQVLTWAQCLHDAEPNSIRAVALMSASEYRLGRHEEALRTVRSWNSEAGVSEQDRRWELFRRSIEVLCLHQLHEDPLTVHRKAIELADYMIDSSLLPVSLGVVDPNKSLTTEALLTQGASFSRLHLQSIFSARANTTSAEQPPQRTATATYDTFFRMVDRNGDGKVTEVEALPRTWTQFSPYDQDGIAGLSRAEWIAANFLSGRQSQSAPVTSTDKKSAFFAKLDKNQDKEVSKSEAGEAWTQIRMWDTDDSEAISEVEYDESQSRQGSVQSLLRVIQSSPDLPQDIEKLILDYAIKDYPGEMNLLNQRAWLLSTSKNDGLRNGEQAVQDALKSCEISGYAIPTIIDTLAAAYAEQGDFEKAVQYGERACAMVGTLDDESIAMRKRLELFREKKPHREPPRGNDEAPSTSPESQPLISKAQLETSRRIRGGEPCWSPDGKRLIYALTGFSPEQSYLESLDLMTGEKQLLCRGGHRPRVSPIDGSIAMERGDSTAGIHEIWLVDQHGKNERLVSAKGYWPNWSDDGHLSFVSIDKEASFLIKVPADQLKEGTTAFTPLSSRKVALSKETNVAFSGDGKRLAGSSFGRWGVHQVDDEADLKIGVQSGVDEGRSDWSLNGDWIAYSARVDGKSRVFIVDAKSLKTRVLADIAAIPRWSHDGKTLALGLLSSNEILLIDVSALKDVFVHE